MTRFDENQKDIFHSNYEKTNYSCRNGNLIGHYHKDSSGKLVQVVRPAFIKIK